MIPLLHRRRTDLGPPAALAAGASHVDVDELRADLGRLATELARTRIDLDNERGRTTRQAAHIRHLDAQLHQARAHEDHDAAYWRRRYEAEHCANLALDDRLAAAEGRPVQGRP